MARGTIWAVLPLGLALGIGPLAAQGPLTTQDPASAQPTLPKPMPELTVPGGGSEGEMSAGAKRKSRARTIAGRAHRHHNARASVPQDDRPALANVELLEPLPRPPQPPHVTVPVPGYPLDDFITMFTAPPPPVICQPTRCDRFKPDLRLVDESPVLCTADNP